MTAALFNLVLDDEDRALLEACAELDKLSKSDVMRRALRTYAAKLGVTERPKRAKTKAKR